MSKASITPLKGEKKESKSKPTDKVQLAIMLFGTAEVKAPSSREHSRVAVVSSVETRGLSNNHMSYARGVSNPYGNNSHRNCAVPPMSGRRKR